MKGYQFLVFRSFSIQICMNNEINHSHNREPKSMKNNRYHLESKEWVQTPLLITPIHILIDDLLVAISDSLCQKAGVIEALYPWLSNVHHLQLSRKDIRNREQSIRSLIGQFNVLVATRCQGRWTGGNFRFFRTASFD